MYVKKIKKKERGVFSLVRRNTFVHFSRRTFFFLQFLFKQFSDFFSPSFSAPLLSFPFSQAVR